MKKTLSILLSLIMVLTMLPTFAVTALAYTEGTIAGTTGNGTLGSPVICDTYAEIKSAMENDDITYVQLNPVSTTNGRIESTKAEGTIWTAIDVYGTKVLIVNGDSTFSAMVTSNMMPVDRLIHINSTGNLTVQGSGSITFRSSLSNGSNAIFYNQGSLTINDNISFNASYNATSNTKAIWQDSGNLTINGGTFSAVSAISKDTRQVVALYANRGTVKINNGIFSATAENGSLSDCYGAEIRTATVTIKEGTFNKGILYSGSLSDCIDSQSRYTIGTDGTVNVELNNFKINFNGNGNPKAFYGGKEITSRFEGEIVNLSADRTYNDKVFDKWVSSDVTISNPTQYNNASFIMPAKDVTITATYKDTHTHLYPELWEYDTTDHWKQCECGEYTIGEHVFTWVIDKEATTTETGLKHEQCKFCGYSKSSVTIEKLPSSHTHSYPEQWESNATDHWKDCECGEYIIGEHVFTWVIDKEATTTETGLKHEQCKFCGYSKSSVTIEKLPVVHTHTYTTNTTPATKSANGKIVKTCSCGDTKTEPIYKPTTYTISTSTYTYDGKVKSPSITIKDSKGNTLKKDTDYTISTPSGRKNVGTYSYKITFKGKYSGTATKSFKINPVKTSISKLTATSKGFKATWSKKSTQVTGYQIQYSTSSKFSSPKTVTVSSYKTTSKTVSKLKAKKKYYVRIRTYKTVNGTKYYSAWSSAKSITTKK